MLMRAASLVFPGAFTPVFAKRSLVQIHSPDHFFLKPIKRFAIASAFNSWRNFRLGSIGTKLPASATEPEVD